MRRLPPDLRRARLTPRRPVHQSFAPHSGVETRHRNRH
jgi:hypothetical protein